MVKANETNLEGILEGKRQYQVPLYQRIMDIAPRGLRHLRRDQPVVAFSLASTERWKGPDGQPQEHTEWHRIVAWAGLAEICHQYLHKGSRIYVEGKLRTNKWQDQAGADRYSTEIVIHDMKMLNPRKENGSAASHDETTFQGSAAPVDEPPSF